MTVLYRCPTRTNVLCPCGKVARALERHGVEYELVRVPYRKGRRPQVQELTGQRHVPVLVIDDQAIVDSRRIIEYLDWRAATPPPP